MAALTVFLMGAVYCLVVPGRPRTYAKAAVAVIIAVFCLARLYLAVDHPDDVLFGVALGVAIPVTAFRYFTPNEVFPVVYRRGRTAHVDVTGRRGEAIRQAVHDQLGLTVLEIKPVGLESSAGSTPLRLRVEGGPDEYLFAKLYTKGHVRADRWYKLWRTILYGSLEDEHPFQTVRRLTEYEDYALRLLQDAGIRTARPYGIVEITPEREYMLVTEFFAGRRRDRRRRHRRRRDRPGAAADQEAVGRRDRAPGHQAGQPHGPRRGAAADRRGLRPGPPSPWRQAVDLGNMMLVLAVRTDPERVYQRALRYFTPDELAEAFAATRGVASPTQLRAFMKRDPRDLLGAFRALAPPRQPIALQRWSIRRVGLACAVLGATVVAVFVGGPAFNPAEDIGTHPPLCGTGHPMILAAQAVPSAALVPCVAALPSGWQVTTGADIASGHARFWLDSDQAGMQAVTITLSATCDVSGARQIPSDQPGTRRFERPLSLQPAVRGHALLHLPRRLRHLPVQFRAWRVPPARDPGRRRGGLHAPGHARGLRQEHRRPGAVRAGRGMSGMSGPAAAKEPEETLLAAPGRDVAVTATVMAVTAVVFAAVADHGRWRTSSAWTTRGCGSWSPAGQHRSRWSPSSSTCSGWCT